MFFFFINLLSLFTGTSYTRLPSNLIRNPEYSGYGQYFIEKKEEEKSDIWSDVKNPYKNNSRTQRPVEWKDAEIRTKFPIGFGEFFEDENEELDDINLRSGDDAANKDNGGNGSYTVIFNENRYNN